MAAGLFTLGAIIWFIVLVSGIFLAGWGIVLVLMKHTVYGLGGTLIAKLFLGKRGRGFKKK